MELKVGFVCDRGLNPKRPVNQDRFLAVANRGLFAVFDGVGGQRAGEIASQTAAETIEEALAHTSADSSTELIRRAVKFANRDIFEMAESDPAYKTMATTIALLHIAGQRATIAHVGDSRVYRLEDGHFYRETIDHTDFNDDLRAGLVNEKQASELEGRNVINRALGVEPDVDVEIKTVSIHDGVRFLLCSDGIYRHLSDEEIARLLAENKDPQRAADELKRIVHERGAGDNLTAVVVQVGRARQSRVLAVESSKPDRQGEKKIGAEAASKVAANNPSRNLSRAARTPSAGGRIQVEFNSGPRGANADSVNERQPRSDWQINQARGPAALPDATRRSSATGKIMYTLLVLVLVAGAFYAGLHASDLTGGTASNRNASTNAFDSLRTGRDAFDNGNYQAAAAEFDALLKREPQNAQAQYWLGRAQLEQREYLKAVENFKSVISRHPANYDAYIQAAAAYEGLGDKASAEAMLRKYGEERRKQPLPAVQ